MKYLFILAVKKEELFILAVKIEGLDTLDETMVSLFYSRQVSDFIYYMVDISS